MKKFVAASAVALLAALSNPTFAGGIEIEVPGLFKGSGGTGSTVTNSTITVSGNRATNIVAGGGSASAGPVSAELNSVANVNSVNISGSTVRNSTISVTDNNARDVTAIGGAANVNSVNIN